MAEALAKTLSARNASYSIDFETTEDVGSLQSIQGGKADCGFTSVLVLSTAHTNSAVATVARLTEMGLEPYLLASSVRAIVAQRLVRKICATCKADTTMSPGLRHFFREGEHGRLQHGTGCSDCRGTGFRGRIGIYEFLQMTTELSNLLLKRAPESKIVEIARAQGMRTLREECLNLVLEGETTLEEVLRVTGASTRPAAGRVDERRTHS